MTDLKSALEAVLFAAGDPVPIARLSLSFAIPPEEIESAAMKLAEEYEREERGIRLLRMEDRLQLCSAPDYASLITRTLEQRRPPMLSAAALETLAVVAYYQPVTRAVIEKMRGVDSSYTVSSLQEKGLITAKRNPSDRRSTSLAATAEGLLLADKIKAAVGFDMVRPTYAGEVPLYNGMFRIIMDHRRAE